MHVSVEQVSKRFGTEYILRDLNFTLQPNRRHVLVGPNGSGKSTLMKMLSGFLSPTKGRIKYFSDQNVQILPDQIYKQISFAAPYLDLIEEFTMLEMLRFHEQTRAFLPGIDHKSVIDLTELNRAAHRQISHFSSGMKQRLKIAIALCTQSEIVLLDEPTTNLDQDAVKWYMDTTLNLCKNRILVVASNDPSDIAFGEAQIEIMKYK
jgi:ABC-type multidrug transport system ATPase subunit